MVHLTGAASTSPHITTQFATSQLVYLGIYATKYKKDNVTQFILLQLELPPASNGSRKN